MLRKDNFSSLWHSAQRSVNIVLTNMVTNICFNFQNIHKNVLKQMGAAVFSKCLSNSVIYWRKYS